MNAKTNSYTVYVTIILDTGIGIAIVVVSKFIEKFIVMYVYVYYIFTTGGGYA